MRPTLFLLVLLVSFSLFSQRTERGFGPVYLERNNFQFNLLMPGFQYEFGLARNLTVGAEVGLSLATPTEGYSLAPAYRAFSRYYHNLKSRASQNKNVTGNSGNYFSVSFQQYFVEWELAGNLDNEGRDLNFLGVLYGIQRTYNNGFAFGAEVGAGNYFRNRISGGIGPAVNFKISWNPFHKRKQNRIPEFD
ncbi:hypothetical protein [Robiginitalea aurantiaca]|uniref:DUF3575 domain-containing protein n=1 Tax=Robiginitalea aurantiaca TaxID=3056915 RepID=A0ABT7WDJ0_9FLAO|nr:hypothetical protein [Robiginitalea aurantiaca]MDM9630982.1 hypothetical protein [Robiginitalea aurantiaca]